MRNRELVQRFLTQLPDASANNLYYRGRVLYSYGEHWPLAYIVGSKLYVNTDSYSSSTSRHLSYVYTPAGFRRIDTTLDELQAKINEREGTRT